MSEATGKPKKILAVADGTDAQAAVTQAHALAQRYGASLEVVACVEPPHDLSILSRLAGEDAPELVDKAVEQTRERTAARLAAMNLGHPIPVSVLVGKAYFEIIRHVATSECDLVVKMAEPLSGLDRFLFASTDQHLLRKCPCSVWLLTPGATHAPKRILAAVDLDTQDAAEPQTMSALNRRVIAEASMIANADAEGAELFVLHAWDAIGEGMVWAFSSTGDGRLSADQYVNEILHVRHSEMDQFLADMRREIAPSLPMTPRLTRGQPEVVIQAESRDLRADLVVMGTVARTGLSGVFIGNTAENIINSLDCPVLAVKPEGFVSPLLRG